MLLRPTTPSVRPAMSSPTAGWCSAHFSRAFGREILAPGERLHTKGVANPCHRTADVFQAGALQNPRPGRLPGRRALARFTDVGDLIISVSMFVKTLMCCQRALGRCGHSSAARPRIKLSEQTYVVSHAGLAFTLNCAHVLLVKSICTYIKSTVSHAHGVVFASLGRSCPLIRGRLVNGDGDNNDCK